MMTLKRQGKSVVSPEAMAEHVNSVRESVELFLRISGIGSKFSDLLEFMNKQFRTSNEQTFKEWTQKEFPGQFVYSHTLTATYDEQEQD